MCEHGVAELAPTLCSSDVDNGELGFDELAREAEVVFRAICPTDEYLPSAPNPEDIVWEGGEDADPASAPVIEPQQTAYGTQYYSLDAYDEVAPGVLQLPEGAPSLAAPPPPHDPPAAGAAAPPPPPPSSASVVLPESGDSSA